MRTTQEHRENLRGQALVEMALVIALFLAMVLGIMEFGSAFMVAQAMTSAAREGARFASVQDPTRGDYQSRVRSRVIERLSKSGVLVSDANVEVLGPAVRGNGQNNDNVTVTVRLQYRSITGANLNFFLGNGEMNAGIPLMRQVTMRQES